jgi:hypothetical protein
MNNYFNEVKSGTITKTELRTMLSDLVRECSQLHDEVVKKDAELRKKRRRINEMREALQRLDKSAESGKKYERVGTFTLGEVYTFLDSPDVTLNGFPVNKDSLRYGLFRANNSCVGCGLQGLFYALERDGKSQKELYHLNLYGLHWGREVLFTKDHIKPRCRGGKDVMENLQTMCVTCNIKKGSDYAD